jgi:hypothetical protein
MKIANSLKSIVHFLPALSDLFSVEYQQYILLHFEMHAKTPPRPPIFDVFCFLHSVHCTLHSDRSDTSRARGNSSGGGGANAAVDAGRIFRQLAASNQTKTKVRVLCILFLFAVHCFTVSNEWFACEDF